MSFLSWIMRAISAVFHPWLILMYGFLLLWWTNPYLFQSADTVGTLLLMKVFIASFLFPVLITGMMVGLGLVSGFPIEKGKSRILPLIGTMLFYIWLYVNLYMNGGTPEGMLVITLGVVLSLIAGFVGNLLEGISFHALGMGTLSGIALLIYLFYGYGHVELQFQGQTYLLGIEWIVLLVIWMTGWVMTARLQLGSASLREVYGSAFLGFGLQWVALGIIKLVG